ncbi:AsmA-like C-terminal region-containing protein [Flavitalea sp. BT771]|uniref:AsmA-like C-terminal region-containing protein n=1 Tax=Flavitalea sp. BT771 TaxID=3063329 RepID=UPI0026E19197|nr:AsmA-like C-terminal region-containing protein [Flavitalea sp. BT771]MDO6433397.1 AsmA-like C-terminal region-containing protein [Flavitalea sp. BT771]MDV6222698.1 AsmA-like C-terminal region-containing protein [Flavitalea sp. BT771]
MAKILRYFLWIAGSLGCLLVLAWLGLALYVTVRKQTIIESARTELRNRMGGDASIGDMEISFFHHFPNITLHLSKVTLRDSLWQQHHHDLLNAEDIYLHVAIVRSLFSGAARLGTVYIERGTIYIFTDSTGYSNTSALQGRRQEGGKDADVRPPDFSLLETRLVMEKQDRHKLFDLAFHRLECAIAQKGRAWSLNTHVDARVKSFAFNTEKGSFLKDKTLAGHFTLQFNTASKIIQFNKIKVQIDGHPFLLTGRFFPDVKPDPFLLHIQTSNIPYRKATALLTPIIQQKLDLYEVDKPVSVEADLDAGSADDPTPLMKIHMSVQHAGVLTPAGRFNDVTVLASFTNEWVHHEKRRDENSAVQLTAFTGTFLDIPLHCDTATVTDLKHPMMDCDLHTAFALTRLNDLAGSRTIEFRKGSCRMNVHYTGPLKENDSARVSLFGEIDVDSAAVTYLPYNFQLTEGVGKIRLRDQDLLFDRLQARTGSSKIGLKGIVRNIAPMVDQRPTNVSMDFTLSSPKLDLEDLTAVLGKPVVESPSRKTSGHPLGEPASRLDQLLRDGVIRLQIEAAELRYQHFTGARARAELLFQDNEVQLKSMQLAQEDGSLSLSGTFRRRPGGGGNPLFFRSHIEQVDVHRLFAEFSDFGQEAITNKNLKGSLTADVEMSGLLTDKARLIKNSMKGTVSFSLKGGELIDFEPMQKIHETVLKKRDFSQVRFAELKNQLELDTSTLTIHRMEIQSTAFSLFVEGTYDLKGGPDLSLQVPVSNLKKDRDPDVPPDSKGNDGKAGLSLRLRVRRGDDGKIKINWDPFKKALKGHLKKK